VDIHIPVSVFLRRPADLIGNGEGADSAMTLVQEHHSFGEMP
jgi:hypothetical protein